MVSCDPNIWMNGVIICSIGAGFFLTSFILNASLRLMTGKSKLFNFKLFRRGGYDFKNETDAFLPDSSADSSVLQVSVRENRRSYVDKALYF